MNFKAFLNTVTTKAYTMPVVILYVTEGCNLKCLSCSYRKPMPGELNFDEISSLADQLNNFGLRHIVYSGGEPLLRNDFIEICKLFSRYNVKQTLLTNGLLLAKRALELNDFFHEIIVSLDGADAETHNRLRGVNSFDVILEGIKKIKEADPKAQVSIRTVLQKQNFRQLHKFIELAESAAVNRISFLAADVQSEAYGRDNLDVRSAASDTNSMILDAAEITEFRSLINDAAEKYKELFARGFISESPAKLMHIAEYYSAINGKGSFPPNKCNAPMVSAVITSTGDIHPCFFLPKYGNIRNADFKELVNSSSIRTTRSKVKVLEFERCRKCVCTLYSSPRRAINDNF